MSSAHAGQDVRCVGVQQGLRTELRGASTLTFLLSCFCLSVGSRARWPVKSSLACLVNSLVHPNAVEETINCTLRKTTVSFKSGAVLAFPENASGQCGYSCPWWLPPTPPRHKSPSVSLSYAIISAEVLTVQFILG